MTKSNILEESELRASLCNQHNQLKWIICTCGSKMCQYCINDHFHNNILFQSETKYIEQFKEEIEDLSDLINHHEDKNLQENMNMNTPYQKQMEIQSLKGFKEKISKFSKDQKIDNISSYYKQNLKDKIMNSITQHYKKKTNSKLNIINKIANDFIANYSLKVSKESSNSNSNEILGCSEKKLKDEMNFDKNLSSGLYLSNKENISPLGNCKRILNNKHIVITNFTTKFNEELINKQMMSDPSNFSIEPTFFQKQINNKKFKTKEESKLIHAYTSERMLINLNIGNNDEFLGSGDSKSGDYVKMVCITCRERFTVLKDQMLWKRRCEVCSENYNCN